ncbi:hypothetical protein ACFWPU_22520 [Streptomyces sp. NPDC058471]|uniref:hypothetical protein n=2 Tax=Streptomyces TaxID=1883 RepID=UPI003659134E
MPERRPIDPADDDRPEEDGRDHDRSRRAMNAAMQCAELLGRIIDNSADAGDFATFACALVPEAALLVRLAFRTARRMGRRLNRTGSDT